MWPSRPTAWPTGARIRGGEEGLHLSDLEELLHALDLVYASGYPDHMVIQEFIPGDDTYMRVMTNYSDRSGR